MEYLKVAPCFWLFSWKDILYCCFLMKWCTATTQPEVKRANKLLLSNSGLKISQFRTLKSLPLWNSRPIQLETLWGQLLIKYILPFLSLANETSNQRSLFRNLTLACTELEDDLRFFWWFDFGWLVFSFLCLFFLVGWLGFSLFC